MPCNGSYMALTVVLRFTLNMLPRGRKFDNDTIDVVNKGCFENFDTLACVRTSFLTTVSAITGTSFMVGSRYPQLDFSACFLKLLQFTVICHLHWSLAARTLHREDVVQHVINPVLCLYVLYSTTVALMGMVDVTGTWTECMRPYWLMLSSADFVIVQMFVITAIYVTHRTDGISSLASFKSSQKRDLWTIVIVYEFSAVLGISYDVIMKFVGNEMLGCSAMFGHTQLFYSTVIAVFMMAKFLVPLWTILCVFQPIEGDTRNSEVALASRYNLSKEPLIHVLHEHWCLLLKILLGRFLKSEVIKDKSINELKLMFPCIEKEQSDDDFEIGIETRKTFKKLNLKLQKSMRKFYHTL
uniref:Uncharacterized protein n=1 Tax=Timema poppense TaxID=170557 RepID=A0A7R9GVU1_TIMPO|nr:unnamed protein product [Timema poppensis]